MGTLSSNYVQSVVETCLEVGADPDMLYGMIPGGEPAVKNPTKRFHIKIIPDLLNHVSELTGLEDLGVRVGKTFRPSTFLHVGYALSFARTLTEAITINEKYQVLTQQIGTTRLEISGDDANAIWTPNYNDIEYYRLATDAIFSGYANIGRWLLWQHEQPIKLMRFRHSAPSPSVVPSYEFLFRSPVEFGADTDVMVFDAALANVTLPNSNPELVAHLCERLDVALAELKGKGSLKTEALHCIQLQLTEGKPSLPETASRMAMSERTLRRRLSEAELTYGALLEEARKQACEVYMRQNIGLSQLALMLGYTDQSAFTRAFKKWFGVSPGKYQPGQLVSP